MKKMLVVLVMASVLSTQGTVFGAPTDTVTITKEEQQQINQTIATLEKEIKTLRDRIEKVEKVKAEKSDIVKSNISFSGDSRIRYIDKHTADGNTDVEERVRLAMKAQVAPNVDFYGRMVLINNNEFGTTGDKDRVQLIDGNFTYSNLFGSKYVMLGRFTQNFLATTYWAATGGCVDGVKVGLGSDKFKFNVAYANWAPATTTAATYKLATVGGVANVSVLNTAEKVYMKDAIFADAEYQLSKDTKLYGMWLKETMTSGDTNPFNVRGIGINTRLNKDFVFLADYTENIANTKGLGYYFSLRFKEANMLIPNSWGLRLDYRKIQVNNNVPAITGLAMNVTDVKGPAISAHYVPAKNCVLNAYQGFATRKSDGSPSTNYTRVEATYNF